MAAPLRQALRRAAAPIWQAIFRHPFIVEIGAGTLPREKFAFFISQDFLYLQDFARVLCLGGAKAPDRETMDLFARHAHNTVLVEQAMHQVFARRLGLTQRALEGAPLQPVTQAYTRHLLSVAHMEGLAELTGAILPCYWIYQEVGRRLRRFPPKEPLYTQWVRAYAGKEFGALVQEQFRLIDRLGREATAAQRQRMTAHFVTSSRYEYLFWEQAYQLRGWPV
jgi:thiaminase/transcriptional activator TenA